MDSFSLGGSHRRFASGTTAAPLPFRPYRTLCSGGALTGRWHVALTVIVAWSRAATQDIRRRGFPSPGCIPMTYVGARRVRNLCELYPT